MSQIPFGSKVLFEEAKEHGFQPQWETKFGLFSIKRGTKTIYIYSTKLAINSNLGSYLTKDKYTTSVILEKNSFPTVPYLFTNNVKELHDFFDVHQPIIAKPVMGERSQNTKLIEERDDLSKFPLDETIFEKFILGIELRYLVLKGQIVAAQSKSLNPTPQYPWRKHVTNLKASEYDTCCVEMALAIAKLVGQQFLAVDFIEAPNGKILVLELNSVPGLYSLYNPDDGNPIALGKLLFETIIET